MDSTQKNNKVREGNEHDLLDAELLSPEMKKIMTEAGISVKELIKHGKMGMNADKVRYDRDGEEIGTTPDWNVRHKYWAGFLEIYKLVHGQGVTINNNSISTAEKKEKDEAFNRVFGLSE